MHGCNVPDSLYAFAACLAALVLMSVIGAVRLWKTDPVPAWLLVVIAICSAALTAATVFVIHLCRSF